MMVTSMMRSGSTAAGLWPVVCDSRITARSSQIVHTCLRKESRSTKLSCVDVAWHASFHDPTVMGSNALIMSSSVLTGISFWTPKRSALYPVASFRVNLALLPIWVAPRSRCKAGPLRRRSLSATS